MSPRKTRRGSWCPLVENRDEWGTLFRYDPIKSRIGPYGPFVSRKKREKSRTLPTRRMHLFRNERYTERSRP